MTSEVVSTPHHKQRVLVVTNYMYLIEVILIGRIYNNIILFYYYFITILLLLFYSVVFIIFYSQTNEITGAD